MGTRDDANHPCCAPITPNTHVPQTFCVQV